MNRMRTLLVIGVFMLSLAVLAALEWRVQEPVASEGQMVTGSLSKEVPSLPQLPDLSTVENGKGVLVPLDNGTLRGSTGSALDMVAKAPTETSSPTAPETAAPAASETPAEAPQAGPAPVGDIAPVGTFNETSPAPVEEKAPQEEPKAEPRKPETPAKAEAEKKQPSAPAKSSAVVLTTKAPAKLEAGQTAITGTRLELDKDVVFRMTGAAPLKFKTMLLKDPHRYVGDLQGKWGIQVPRVPKDLWIKDIRVGHHEGATRLVFELTRAPESAKVVQINANTVEVRIK